MSDKSGITWTHDGILDWFNGPDWDEVVKDAFLDSAPGLVAAAQADAPWEDRTGDARNQLHTEVEINNGEVNLYLGHGVEYGFWLETIQNGNFAVIMPTLERLGPSILREVAEKVGRSRRGN